MYRSLLTIFLGLGSALIPVSADPVDERVASVKIDFDESDLFTIISPLDDEATSDDYLMPSLSEMLGEPVDNYGFITGNEELQADLVSYAKNYLGCRYRSGAKGPTSFDCSGFTGFVFKKFGYSLNPSSLTQGTQGEEVELNEAEVGDLIFFSGRRVSKTVGHVGMIIDVDRETGVIKFIHASVGNGVMIDTYPDGGYYSKRFISVRHILSDETVASAD